LFPAAGIDPPGGSTAQFKINVNSTGGRIERIATRSKRIEHDVTHQHRTACEHDDFLRRFGRIR
jgi:hypothetical protein